LVDVIKKAGVSRRSRAEPSNLSAGGDSLMGSGSEDEDEDGSAHHHHHDSAVRGAHLGTHNIGPGGPGDQTVGHGGELPLGSDPCKQEDSEDQGKSSLFLEDKAVRYLTAGTKCCVIKRFSLIQFSFGKKCYL